jgi:hypothetical protein
VSGTTQILDAVIAAGVKQVIITASIASPVSRGDFWKEITITEKCECSKKKQKGGIWRTYAPYLLQHTACRRQKMPSNLTNLDMMPTVGLADTAARDFKSAHPDLDLTTNYPSFVYGPIGLGQVYNSP